MGLKKYIFFSIVFLAVIGGYVFLSVQGEHTVIIETIGLNLTLPIAIWVILPAAVLVVATILHILFYGFRNFLQIRAIEKDEENLMGAIKDNLLGNNSNRTFKIKAIKDVANILSQLKFEAKSDNFECSNKEINEIMSAIQEINEGKYVYDKSLKFNKASVLTSLNIQNRIDNDIDFCLDVLKKSDSYDTAQVKQAFFKVVEEKSMTTIKKMLENITLDKDMVLALIEKDAANSEFSLDEESLLKYIKEVDFNKEDFVHLVKTYKTAMQPDDLIRLCETLSNENDEAMSAYFYVLFEFEMLDRIRELLNAYGAHEFTAYRALIDLKDSGRNYTVDSLSYK
jgi:hypothetical protein